MSDPLPTATYKLGTHSGNFTLTTSHTQDTAYGTQTIPAGTIQLRPWVLNHVDEISINGTSTASVVGIPNKPAECAQIFDVNGPIRTITIQGRRYDNEEYTSNLDFIHTQFNPQPQVTDMVPFTGQTVVSTNCYSVGIEWLTSTMQATLKGYTFIIETQSSDSRLSPQTLNVGLTSFTYSFDADNPGIMTYSITLVERIEYPQGPIYREYHSPITRSN